MSLPPHTILVFLLASLAAWPGSPVAAGDESLAPEEAGLLRRLCFDCHAGRKPAAHLDLEKLASRSSMAAGFQTWRKAASMLEAKKMPPEDAQQPNAAQRRQLISAIRGKLQSLAKERAGDPGAVVVRRLTSAEYAYTIADLTGLDIDLGTDFVSDAVGGEGFTNFGAAQFVQDATLERYLEAAKKVAAHAVIGAGPLRFYRDPGKTGFELSAIARIQEIYRRHGFRTAAGEGGEAFGLDRYPRAFFTAWRFRHRHKLGLGRKSLADLAAEEGLDVRFVEYVESVMKREPASHPTSEIVSQWRALPVPKQDDPRLAADVRTRCEAIYRRLHDWQTKLGQNADDKEEAPVLTADSIRVVPTKSFVMNLIWTDEPVSSADIHLLVETAGEVRGSRDKRPEMRRPTVIWRNPSIQYRRKNRRLRPAEPLSSIVSADDAGRLAFGKHSRGAKIGPHDFVTTGVARRTFRVPVPEGATSAKLTIETELDLEHGDDCIVRCTISETKDPAVGSSVSGLLANPQGAAFKSWMPGVIEFARVLPQISQREPAPSDRDPIPPPFDNTYNNPERNHFHYKIKYHRDDRFLVEHVLDDATRQRLDEAWNDLLGSFEYHDAYLRFVAKKYKLDLAGRQIEDVDAAWIERLPAGPREYVKRLHDEFHAVQRAFAASAPRRVEDVIQFAHRAWRRPLGEKERDRLRAYYRRLKEASELGHVAAVRTLLARVLMGPEFLYRAEKPRANARIVPLTDWELASRLSYFLWSSPPDEELRRAAAAGELRDPAQLARQAARMLRDVKARRFAAEFFGQWFGFYRFDRYQGVDPKRYPQFTDNLKKAMHEEAVAFFEHLVRKDRPVREILFADYSFLNRQLAEHYGVQPRGELSSDVQRMENSPADHRGGLLGLGAILTATSAPRRTSPVKRGDWVLRRLLGTPVPPPPADAGSLPADDVLADGLTVRKRLEAHRRAATCMNCHSRIDPLGFALEQYDAIGRWREKYRDGQPIDPAGQLRDGTVLAGPRGLRAYLQKNERLFHHTLCKKLLGYALGRNELISDAELIEQMMTDLKNNGRLSTLVKRMVASRQFRFRRGNAIREEKP